MELSASSEAGHWSQCWYVSRPDAHHNGKKNGINAKLVILLTSTTIVLQCNLSEPNNGFSLMKGFTFPRIIYFAKNEDRGIKHVFQIFEITNVAGNPGSYFQKNGGVDFSSASQQAA